MTELTVRRATAEGSAAVMVQRLQEWVAAESPSSDPEALRRFAALLSAQIDALLGGAARKIEAAGLQHLCFEFGDRSANGQRVLLLCHYDTVWPIGSWGGQPVSVETEVAGGPVLRGPGAYDMKAGTVQCVQALHLLQSAGQQLDGVRLLVTADEEVGSLSSRSLIEEVAADCDAVLVFEASADGGALKTGRKGTSIYRMLIEGRAAHAGLEPEKGINATVETAHQVLAIAALADPALGTTVTPTRMNSGETGNTVPAQAELSIDVRARSKAELQRVDAAIRALPAALEGSRLRLEGGINRPPLDTEASASLYQLSCEVAAELGLAPTGWREVGGASDGNFTAGMGIPTLDGLGAVGGGAHARDEHVELSTMPERTALAAGLIERLLQGALQSVPRGEHQAKNQASPVRHEVT